MKKCMLVFLMLLVCCANGNKPQDGAIRVNGTWIKKDNIDKVVELYKQQMLAAFPQKSLEGIPPTVKKNIAQQLIANELVLQEARKRKMPCDSARLEQMLEGIKKQFPDSAALDRELAKMGQTRQDMHNQVRDGLLIDTLIKSLSKPSDSVSEKACKEYYDGNQPQFASEKRFRVSQILFVVKKDASAAQKKAAADKAAKVLAEVKAGKDFAAEAKKYSEDPSTAKAGGDIGWFKKGDLKKEFDVVATPLKQNEVSNVFETDAGFHIAKKTGEEMLPPEPFEKAKDQIAKMLTLKKQNDIVKHFIDSLMVGAKIEYADTSYKLDKSAMAR
jgi:parvulin-like peptidyl-prolyl isomerase